MKKLVVVFLCFFASNAYASSADSGKCPWPIPFTITIGGIGSAHSYANSCQPVPGSYITHDTDYGTVPSNEGFMLTIDTTSSYLDDSVQYSLNGDVLRFSTMHPASFMGTPIPSYSTLEIDFAYGNDYITRMKLYSTDSTVWTLAGNGSEGYYYYYNFQISGLNFNDSSILASDSSFTNHNILFTYSNEQVAYNFGPYDFSDIYNDFTASSVTLSGIFRPTTFSNPPSIVTEAPQPITLAIYSSNGSIACSFDVSDHARDLEIFTPLGIREASYNIQAGQTEASLPHLPAGFYFVRMEGSMAKVYIAH